jgi:GNAT superfamily N-acetyltransferase
LTARDERGLQVVTMNVSDVTPSIRPAANADAEVIGSIAYHAFHRIATAHNFPPDFPNVDAGVGLAKMMLGHPRIYGVVAEIDGKVAGSNFLWELSSVAGVGPITVDPQVQNAQVGRALMQAVLNRASEKAWASVRLVQAAYHNRSLSLYTKLGFDAREPLSVVQGQPIRKAIPGHAVRKATAGDLPACNALCTRVHGHDRHGELTDALAQGGATVVERDGRITGYATGVGFFGHAVGEANDDVKALIAAAPEFGGPGMLVPTRNAELMRWCLGQGLRVVQPMTLMSRGLYNEPRGAFLPSILF